MAQVDSVATLWTLCEIVILGTAELPITFQE